MSDYWVMIRLDVRKLINYIVEIRRTPKKLISYALFLAWLGFILVPQFMGNRKNNLGLEINPTTITIILGIYALLVGMLIFSTLFPSLKKLYFTFSMGDVNLLFPSPIEPQRILFWSMLKKIPTSLIQTMLPVLFLTPMLLGLGIKTQGLFFIYASFVSLALIISPLAFLVFLLSVRRQRQGSVRSVLIGLVVWLVGSWLWQVRGSNSVVDLLTGYQAAGIWQFPVVGWILRLADAGFSGASDETYGCLLGIALTLVFVNVTVYRLAKDYYEDVLGHSEKMDAAKKQARSGRPQLSQAFAKLGGKNKVSVQGTYPESKAFLFKQIVSYRSTGFNEYLGWLTPLALAAGLVVGFLVSQKGIMDPAMGLFAMNGGIVYILILTSSVTPVNAELGLPYIYVLPGTFQKKVLALNALPVLRFSLNMFLLNLSYTFLANSGMQGWGTAVTISLMMITLHFALSNSVIIGNVLLPSALDRKIFYPLMIMIQMLVIIIPAGLIGGGMYLIFRSQLALELGIIVANVGVGFLLLRFSEKLFSYIEMREYSDS
ncbi:MAG TPA: putative ABC exporter domain-containing protein [Desulfosporosinus sp.]|nr:putative ABC exporter domain-containing protein [Desulfosporosinus sp.]